MEKKIIAIMMSLVVIAALVVAFVMIAAGGSPTAGGFTKLFDQLEYSGDATYNQYLEIPADWQVGDEKTVSDTIFDLTYYRHEYAGVYVYVTTLWFMYVGDKWADSPTHGNMFFVPVEDGWLRVEHGQFSITVSSATNLSEEYSIGDVITLNCQIIDADDSDDVQLAFSDWVVEGVQ